MSRRATHRHRSPWGSDDLAQLRSMLANGYTTARIAEKLGRTPGAVQIQIHRLRQIAKAEQEAGRRLREAQATPRVVYSRSYFWGLFTITKTREHEHRLR